MWNPLLFSTENERFVLYEIFLNEKKENDIDNFWKVEDIYWKYWKWRQGLLNKLMITTYKKEKVGVLDQA